jgi:hypothetical protein
MNVNQIPPFLASDPLPPIRTPHSTPVLQILPPDNSSGISPTAGLLSQLDQLPPAQFSKVTSSIATQLEAAAPQLAAEFKNAAQTGKIPSAKTLHAHSNHHALLAETFANAMSATNSLRR